MSSSVFKYTCAKCGAIALKPPCQASKDHDATLGTWRCSNNCSSHIKVKRERVRDAK